MIIATCRSASDSASSASCRPRMASFSKFWVFINDDPTASLAAMWLSLRFGLRFFFRLTLRCGFRFSIAVLRCTDTCPRNGRLERTQEMPREHAVNCKTREQKEDDVKFEGKVLKQLAEMNRRGAVRVDDFKFQFFNQPSGWTGPKLTSDVPTMYNIRQDPFERFPTLCGETAAN